MFVNGSTEERVDVEDWARFRQVDRLADHWDRHDWPPERRYLSWYIVFDSPSLADYVKSYQAPLADLDYLDPIPPDGLHMTVQGIAYVDELSQEQTAEIARRAQGPCSGMAPFELRVGPIGGHRGGTFLRTAPWEPVVELRRHIQQAVREVLGPRDLAEPSAGFKPHISVTYCHSDPPAADLISRLEELRSDWEPITVPVTAVSLLEVRRENRTYRWTERNRIPLTGTAD